jgi:hypothetical protein
MTFDLNFEHLFEILSIMMMYIYQILAPGIPNGIQRLGWARRQA